MTQATQPTILLSPLKPAIPAQGGAVDVIVRVQGPEQPEVDKTKVTPKRLSLVIDRSGSMSGQPLHEALKCVEHIAGCMTPEDRISVVVYDDDVQVLIPLEPVTSPDSPHSQQVMNSPLSYSSRLGTLEP
jgi:Ca-activated chloride channel family protein